MKRLVPALVVLVAALHALAADVPGYLYAPDGSPVEGARVAAYVPVARTLLTNAVTAKDGAFVLSGVPEGIVEVAVEVAVIPSVSEGPGAREGRAAHASRPAHPGPSTHARDDSAFLVWTADAPLTLHLHAPLPDNMVARAHPLPTERRAAPPAPRATGAGNLTGTVRVNGKPIANMPVVLQGLADGREVQPLPLVTNAKGQFHATALEPMRYAVVIDHRLSQRFRLAGGARMFIESAEPFVVDLREQRDAEMSLELVAAPTIRGRVFDAEGKPVARAAVQVVMANRSALDFTMEPARTTPDGRYSLVAPEWTPNEQVNVAVAAPLHSTVRSKPFVIGDEDREVNVTLPKFEAVKLRILDRAGKAIPNARVAFASSAETTAFETIDALLSVPYVQRALRADAAGELNLQLAADTYDFAAVADGFQTGSLAAKSIARPSTVDVTLAAAATIRGRVHRNKTGVANIHVNVLGGNRSRRDTFATTDANGAFEIGGIAPGNYRVGFFKSDELIDRTVEVEAPGVIDLELPPSGTLRARVTDAVSGAPIAGFVFSVEPAQAEPGARNLGGVHRGEQSAEGTFTVTVPAGVYRVSAGASGYVASEPVEVRISDTEPALLTIPLGRGVTVAGRVTDEAGAPVAEADVMIMSGDREQTRTRSTPRVGPGQAKTDAGGAFTITGVTPGEAQLNVRVTGYVPFRKVLLADGTMNVDVRLTRGLALRGVVTRGGKPVSGVQVGASTPAIGGEHQPAVSDDDGRFTLTGLIAARYTVSAYLEEEHTEVRDVDPTKQKELVLSLDPKPRGVIYGTVTGIPTQLGKLVRRAVSVQSEHGGAEGMIDDAGNYRIDNAPVGTIYVVADVETGPRGAHAVVRKQVELTAGQPLRVDLELAGNVRVSGRVTHEGKALAGVHVGFSGEESSMTGTVTLEDGAYEVALPAAGRYTIYARAEQMSDRPYQAVRELRGGERIDIDLREQVIEGTVVDAVTRQPIANAVVTLLPVGSGMPSTVAEVPADANGRFRIVTASSGAYRLVASAFGYAHRVLATSGNATQYSFELTRAATLKVRVVDTSTRAALDAHLVITEADGAYVPVRPQRSADGETYTYSLAPGKYRITAVVQGYPSRTVDVTAPGTLEIGV